jgi:putative membrane protein
MKRFGLLSIALATALTVACNSNTRTDTRTADEPNTTIGTSGSADRTVNAGDKHFIDDMIADGTAEIELAKMAEERAASPDVKRFAQMMMTDHTKAGAQLKQIASTYNVQPDPNEDAGKHKDLIDKLSKLRGRDFDREYMSAMVNDHQDAVDALEHRVDIVTSDKSTGDKVKGTFGANKAEAERSGSVKPEKANDHIEASLNSWAADTLPVVRRHLDEAKQINDRLKRARS